VSLVPHLARPESPVRQFVDYCTPTLVESGANTREARLVKELLGIDTLPAVVRPLGAGAHAATVGSAFDYRVRLALAPVDLDSLVAMGGARLAAQVGLLARETCQSFFIDLAAVLADIAPQREVLSEPEEALLARYCVVLALLEVVYRAGAPEGCTGCRWHWWDRGTSSGTRGAACSSHFDMIFQA
jgi:hypothetical protein